MYPFFEIHYIPVQEIQKQADRFRDSHWGNEIPVDIELIVERDMNFTLTPVSGLKSKVNIDALLMGNLKEICYDYTAPAKRIRFSIAHEIGHYIMHKELLQQYCIGTIEEWQNILEVIGFVWGRIEFQANEFAGRLLVPRESLINSVKELEGQIQSARNRLPNLTDEEVLPFILPALSKKFDVSPDVIKIRFEREGIILIS